MAPTNARLALSIPCYCAVGFVRSTSAAAHNGTRRTSSSSCSGPCTSQASTPAQGPRTVTRCITEHSCRRRVVCTAEPHQPLGEPLPTCSSHVGTAVPARSAPCRMDIRNRGNANVGQDTSSVSEDEKLTSYDTPDPAYTVAATTHPHGAAPRPAKQAP